MRSLIIFSILAVAGCDNAETSESVRHDYMDRHSDAFLFEGTTHEYVLRAIKSVLDEHGFQMVPTGDPLVWKTTTMPDNYDYQDEYSVHLTDMRWRKGFFVSLVHISRNKEGKVITYRDDKLEWEVIQRADPDRAAQIMATANDRADKVPPRVHNKN